MMPRNDVLALLSALVGLGSIVTGAEFAPDLTVIFGAATPKVIAYVGLAIAIAGQLLRMLGAPSSDTPPAVPPVPPTSAAEEPQKAA